MLFPGLLLPLHVFEDRYRALVRDLVDGPEETRAFGVVAIREGREVGDGGIRSLHPVGCLADLRQVEPHPDGRFDIVATGARRFRIDSVDACLEALPAGRGRVPRRTRRRRRAGAGPHRSPSSGAPTGRRSPAHRPTTRTSCPTTRSVLSYLVAAATILDLSDKQRLLEEPDTTSRLRRELAILRREAIVLRLLPSLPAVELTRTAVSPN